MTPKVCTQAGALPTHQKRLQLVDAFGLWRIPTAETEKGAKIPLFARARAPLGTDPEKWGTLVERLWTHTLSQNFAILAPRVWPLARGQTN